MADADTLPKPPWWEPESFGLALVVALVSTACWGSWSNTAKAAGDRVNFAHYYTDFCLGTVLTGIVFWLTLGQAKFGREEVDLAKTGFALAAGAVFGVANLLLTTGIALVGLSIAFPLCIGTGLVLGTILTYLIDPVGNPALIFPGVLCALLGVLANAHAYGLLAKSRKSADPEEGESTSEAEPTNSNSTSDESTEPDISSAPAPKGAVRNIIMCLIGGVLMSLWSPLNANAVSRTEDGLSPYWSFVCFCVASMVVGVAILGGQQCGLAVMPRVGPITNIKEYFSISPMLHGWGLLGGCIWAIGTTSNVVSGTTVGFATSYALGQTAPIVAVCWGLAWYREFTGAPRKASMYLAAMFVFFIVAITLLCLSRVV